LPEWIFLEQATMRCADGRQKTGHRPEEQFSIKAGTIFLVGWAGCDRRGVNGNTKKMNLSHHLTFLIIHNIVIQINPTHDIYSYFLIKTWLPVLLSSPHENTRAHAGLKGVTPTVKLKSAMCFRRIL
jgi:hypothetical protein